MNWMPKKMTAARVVRPRPVAREDKLVVEELGDEVLVYDLVTNRAHALSAKAARVWRACDGGRDAEALAAELAMDAAAVTNALDELRDCNLLDGEVPSPTDGLTRRDLAFRTAKAGVAAASVPMIISIAAPTPAAAATPTAAQCMLYTDSDCRNCANVCGCCCCGQAGGSGGTDASCKLCYTSNGCSSFSIPGKGLLNCSVGERDHPNCEPAEDTYLCKDEVTEVTLDDSLRCCDYLGSPPQTTTTT